MRSGSCLLENSADDFFRSVSGVQQANLPGEIKKFFSVQIIADNALSADYYRAVKIYG